MNQKNPSQNSQNIPIINNKLSEKGVILDAMPIENKNSALTQEHTNNSLFKVVQENKESYPTNSILYLNSDKSNNKNASKNINIIKPKFVTKTMNNDDNSLKLKLLEENPSSLNLNLSSSAFQPQIILKDKEFKVQYKNKIYNLLLDVKNEILKLKLYEINENIYSLKYFYENNFSMSDLKQLHNFFYLFDNVSDTMKELEKLLIKYKYNISEDLENKRAKIHIKFILLEKEYNIEFSLFQKTYTKDNLFEILCKKVARISDEYGQKISFLEDKNKYLLLNFYRIMNTLNPINMNYPMNQRGENNMNKINGSFNNKININKNISVIKNSSSNDNKYNNKENNNNYEYDDYNDASGDISNSDNYDDEKELSENKILKNKRKRESSFNSNNKSNYIQANKNNDTTNNINNFNNSDSLNSDNYYFLRDIKSKKIKCKGLFEIIHSVDELHMVINKILFKLSKNKKAYMTSNYENKLQFSIHNLFDSILDGDSAYDFHSKCDFKYNTISVIETTAGRRFGGYTSECFESPNEYFDKKDNLSFVFSFDKMRIYEVIKGKYAISCDKNYGPYFRDDHICIVDEFHSKESGTCIKGKGFNTTKNYELNSGKKYFTIKRLQVFQIKIKNLK